MSYTDRPSDEFISLLRQSGDSDLNVAQADQRSNEMNSSLGLSV